MLKIATYSTYASTAVPAPKKQKAKPKIGKDYMNKAYALFKRYKESTLTAEQALTKQEELLEKYKA